MAKRNKKSRGLGTLGEPAHVARIIVGGEREGNRGPVPKRAIDQIVELATFHAGNASTVSKGRGKWRDPEKGTLYDEESTIIDVIGPASDSCSTFYNRMKRIAARAAAVADQAAVAVHATCSRGKTQADLVTRTGRTQKMTRLRRYGRRG